jgi:GNAT superfamily N-acetyltransferase
VASESGVARRLRSSRALVARLGTELVGTVRLEAKKPWAIDSNYFAPVRRALYLHALAVAPHAQRRGIGRRLVEDIKVLAREWPGDAIRLDAYDHAAGAAPFYLKCGFRDVGHVIYRGVPLVYLELLL